MFKRRVERSHPRSRGGRKTCRRPPGPVARSIDDRLQGHCRPASDRLRGFAAVVPDPAAGGRPGEDTNRAAASIFGAGVLETFVSQERSGTHSRRGRSMPGGTCG